MDALALHKLEGGIGELCKKEDICEACTHHIHAIEAQHREAVWRELPAYFGLGSWENLRASVTVS